MRIFMPSSSSRIDGNYATRDRAKQMFLNDMHNAILDLPFAAAISSEFLED